MFLFRRVALLLTLCLASATVLLAQESSSNSSLDQEIARAQNEAPQNPPDQGQAPPAATPQNQGTVSVQSRIRARRDQRRAQSIRDAYSHLYESPTSAWDTCALYARSQPAARDILFVGCGVHPLLQPAPGRHDRGKGLLRKPLQVGLNFSSITRPAVSTYAVMGGPVYRFYEQPKYSISARVMWRMGAGELFGR